MKLFLSASAAALSIVVQANPNDPVTAGMVVFAIISACIAYLYGVIVEGIVTEVRAARHR